MLRGPPGTPIVLQFTARRRGEWVGMGGGMGVSADSWPAKEKYISVSNSFFHFFNKENLTDCKIINES